MSSQVGMLTEVILLSLSFICIGFALSFGILMSQAIKSFKLKAGLANSVLAVSQIVVSSVFITIVGWFDINVENILIYALLLTATISTMLLAYEHGIQLKGHSSNEQTS